MFDYIKTTYKKGDKLKLTCVNGEFSGEILFMSADSIILKTFEGKTCGIKGSDISFFEEIETPITIPQEEAKPVSQETETASPAPQYETKKETIKKETIEKDSQGESKPTATAAPSSDQLKQSKTESDKAKQHPGTLSEEAALTFNARSSISIPNFKKYLNHEY